MSNLDTFLELNSISKDYLMEAVHLDLRETVLESIVNRMKKDKGFYGTVKEYYFKLSSLEATRKLVQSKCDFVMSDDDIQWLYKCISAYMSKKSTRTVITKETRQQILQMQNGKCANCGRKINDKSMHVDHIIPWDFVGDELKDNYQGLCTDCNLHKSNHVALAVSNIVTNRGKQ